MNDQEPTVDDHFKGLVTESKEDPGVFKDQDGKFWKHDPSSNKYPLTRVRQEIRVWNSRMETHVTATLETELPSGSFTKKADSYPLCGWAAPVGDAVWHCNLFIGHLGDHVLSNGAGSKQVYAHPLADPRCGALRAVTDGRTTQCIRPKGAKLCSNGTHFDGVNHWDA